LKAEFILPFDEANKEIHGKEKKIRGFNEAMFEIQNNPGLVVDIANKKVCLSMDFGASGQVSL
jgi:hypothetical protein